MARLRYLQNKRSGAAGTISKATNRIYFYDDNAYIYAASSGVLHIVATTINLDGAFTFTGTDKLTLGTSAAPLTLTAGTPVMTVYTTCSGAVGTVAQPILFNTVLTGAGQLGGRVRVNMATEVTLGSYANAFKASVDLGTNGGVIGLLSVVCSEMTMATANISGTYAIEEWEMTYAATGSGSLPKPCFVYANSNGTARTVFDDYGDFIIFGTGFTSATGHMFGAGTSTIRLGTGALGGTKRYIPLSTAEASYTSIYPVALGSSGTPITTTYDGSKALAIYTTCASTNTGTSHEPILINTVMTGAGQVGGRVKINMSTNVVLGGWANALKAQVECNTNGRCTGTLSAFCGEVVMPASDVSGLSGSYAALEAEINTPASSVASEKTSFIYFGTGGDSTAITAFQDAGNLFEFVGLGTASSAENLFHSTGTVSATHGLRIRIDDVFYDILLKASTYA